MINKYMIHKFNLYTVVENKDFNHKVYIQMDFIKFETKHFE